MRAPEPPRLVVRVGDLPLVADIGLNPEEIGRPQPLTATVELELAPGPVGALEDTVDYRRVVAAAEALARTHLPLIETFAQRLAANCLAWRNVAGVRVRIDKPFALPRGTAGVEVVMARRAEEPA